MAVELELLTKQFFEQLATPSGQYLHWTKFLFLLPIVGPAKPYSYAYEVVDPTGGNAYGHRESSNGAQIKGEYRVVLPDTRTQIVK